MDIRGTLLKRQVVGLRSYTSVASTMQCIGCIIVFNFGKGFTVVLVLIVSYNLAICTILFCYCCLVTMSCLTLLWPPRTVACHAPCPWDSPGKNTGVGCHFLLQGIFPTQESNACLLHWQTGSLPLNHLGSRTLQITQWSRTFQKFSFA